jgi:RNA polymerase sigma-70 factor (ECF subfamily)
METPDRQKDAALVSAWLAGQREAFGSLYVRWNPKFVRYATRLLSETEEALDACQDGWTDIVRSLERLNDRSLFGVWGYRIITRKCHRRLRRRYRQRAAETALEAETVLAELSPELVQQAEDRMDAETVRRALTCLPRPQLMAMELFYVDGLSIAEIAAVLGVPAGTVKTRLLHGRARVRIFILGEPK